MAANRERVAAVRWKLDPRLEHAVAGDHPPGGRVEPRPVQRVRHRAHQAARRVARHPRVGVQRDHVSDPRQARRVGAAHRIRRVARAAEQPVELQQLAALPLPAHPAALRRVPEPAAMEQEETVRSAGMGGVVAGGLAVPFGLAIAAGAARDVGIAVSLVEGADALQRVADQRVVAGHGLVGRVGEVGEQGEAEARVRVGQVMGLEPLRQHGGAARRAPASPGSR